VGALGVLPAGYAADRVGRRAMLVVSAACGMIGAVAFLPLEDWRGAFVGSSLYWAAIAGLPIMTAHLAATVPRPRLGASLGVVYGAFFLGIILAAPLSGLIAGAYGLRAPFAGAAVLFAASVACDVLISGAPAGTTPRGGPLPGRFWALLSLAPLAGLLAYLPTPLFAVYMRDVARTPVEVIGLLVAAVSLGSALFSAAAGRVADRAGAVPAVVGAAVLVALGSAALVLGSAALPALLIGSLLLGANQAANPVVAAAIERALPPARLSIGYAAFQLAYTGGAGAGSIVAGALHDTDPLLPFLVSAALALPVAGVVSLVVLAAVRESGAGEGRQDRVQ
jgi:MFS family permease